MKLCLALDCDRKRYCRGLCTMHYQRLKRHGSLADPRPTRRQRLMAQISTTSLSPHWLWIGPKSPLGYGRSSWGPAHRVVFEEMTGTVIPDGLQLDHLCRIPACVNPTHLEIVTNRENTIRGYAANIIASRQRALTHCRRGHRFTAENTRLNRKGARCCLECQRMRRADRDTYLRTRAEGWKSRDQLPAIGKDGRP